MFKKLEEILNMYEGGQGALGEKIIVEYLANKPKNAIDDFCVSVAAIKKAGHCELWQKQMLRDFFKEIQRVEKYRNLFLRTQYCEEIRDYMYFKIL